MKYILIGQLLGSIVTSEHDNKEACYGRQKMLEEKGASVQCIEQKNGLTFYSTSVMPLACSTYPCLK